jgi:NAD(P)-dependent dehydrogenase (short-subunit alcohol dehydrogenase family)
MKVLDGRNVLLTGALGTLGRAQARRLADAGANLALVDRSDHPECQLFSKDLGDRTGRQCIYIPFDLGNLDRIPTMVSEIKLRLGSIDILINNAALIENAPFDRVSVENYELQLRVNSTAAFALVQAVSQDMKAKRYGKIINFCSLTLNGRWEGYVPYVASKGALLGLTKSLARELGPHGITVNAISPGAVVSDAEQRVFGDKLAEYAAWILESQSLKTRIQPDHIADAVLFLASPASDMISGHNLAIDAGW